jgi:WD40 repeat protein
VLSVGHAGAVRGAVGHPNDNLAFTVGEDGRLLVWDLDSNALLHRHQVSHRPLTGIVHHPVRNEVAVVASDSVDRSTIIAIAWETGDTVFTRRVDGTPVHMRYSPAGSFLVYSLPTFQSLFFLSADRGSPRTYLDDGFGIVNFTQIGRSERNIMTYVPTRGEFIYWSLQTGEELQTVRTLSRLEHLVLIDPTNRRAIAAAAEDQLVVVDNLTGEVWAEYPVTPVFGITYDQPNDRIMVLTETLGRRSVVSFTYRDGRLRRSSYRPSVSSGALFVAPLAADAAAVVSGDTLGQVALYSTTSGRQTALGPRPTTTIHDVAFTEGRMHLSLGDRILSLVSDAFESDNRSVRISTVRSTVTPVPGTTAASLQSDGDRVLIWGDSENPGTVFELAPPGIEATVVYRDELENPVVSARFTPTGPVVVHRDGRVLQLSPELDVERYRYTARGALAADWSADTGLVIAKTKSSNFDSSIIRIDQLTGETVAVRSSAFLTTDFSFAGPRTLYGIGLFGSPGAPQTRLTRFSGSDLGQQSVVGEFDGEDTQGRTLWDQQTRTLYTTLGYGGLQEVRGRLLYPLGPPGQIAREIVQGGLFTATVNRDGSVSIWDRNTKDFLFDLYVTLDNEFIAMNPRGAFLASSRTLERYLDVVSERQTRLEVADFRIGLPFIE